MKTPTHKIKFVFHPDQPYIEVRLDNPLRSLFAQAADQARFIYKNKEIRTAAEFISPRLLVEWGTGLDALDKIAYVPSDPIHLTPWEIHQALNLASSACLGLLLAGEKITPLPETIVILASIAPCRIEPVKLPAAIKLWPRTEIAPAMREIYENIRHQCRESEAWLPVLTAYSLRCELLKLDGVPQELLQLISRLGEVSKAFEYTIQRLAQGGSAEES